MQNCGKCHGKKWLGIIDPKTGYKKFVNGKPLYRCWRCGNKQTEPDTPQPEDMRVRAKANILYFDLEISKSLYVNFGAKVKSGYMRPENKVKGYYCISWAASYLWKSKVYSGCVTVDESKGWTDKNHLQPLHDLMDSADILAGHNVDAYDVKRANTRFLLNGIAPVMTPDGKKKPTLDTLKIARNIFSFESNSLDSIANELGLRGKDAMTNEDWNIIAFGEDKDLIDKTLRKMDKYCRNDVREGKKILEILMPYSGKPKHYGTVGTTKLEDLETAIAELGLELSIR